MSRVRLLVLMAVVASCSKGDSLVVVSVTADERLAGVAALRATSTAGGRSSVHEFANDSTFTLPPAMTFGVDVPASIVGPFTVHVDALDATTSVLAAGDGMTTLSPGHRVDIAIPLIGTNGDGGGTMDAGGDDLAPPPDLSSGIVFVPASKDFASLQEGMQSAATLFTVQNQAGVATAALSTSLTGSDAAQFHLDADSCSGLQLAPAATCTVSVSFRPTGAGARVASLAVGAGVASLSGRALGNDGTACSADGDCGHGHCVDGVCCAVDASACGGCNACNVAGKEGTCTPVPVGTDPHNFCSATCTNKCDGAGACRAGNAGATCSQTCADAQNVNSFHCDGTTVACPTTSPTTAACPSLFACDVSVTKHCFTTCTSDAQCQPTAYCNAGVCVAQLTAGQSCTRDRQCTQNAGPAECTNNVCTSCGIPGEPCCRDSACTDALCNSNGMCVACGQLNQPCCPGGTCTSIGSNGQAPVCSGGQCVACGGVGQPCCGFYFGCGSGNCCDGNNTCVANGATCAASGGTCSNGSCQSGACGARLQPCCTGSWCTGAGLACVSGLCNDAGNSGEPCGQVYKWCYNMNGLTCSAGTCTSTCGGSGQVCCRYGGLDDTCSTAHGCPSSNVCP